MFGTNPICFGTPTSSKVPFIFDTSVSVINRGKIRRAAKLGKKIPFGVALDNKGNPTIDAQKALNELSKQFKGVKPDNADVIVALGGDGLILHTLETYGKKNIPIYILNGRSTCAKLSEK